jgi:hypothetical protein
MNMHIYALTCHVCGLAQSLTCKVTQVGEGLWVSLLRQQCGCNAYAAWQSVWAEARWQARPSQHDPWKENQR